MSIKLIASDLDGTLLTDKKELSPGTRKALDMAAAQGIDLRKDTPSAVSHKVYDMIRSKVAYWEEDREIRIDVEAMNELVRSGEIIEAVSMLLPDFE